MIFEIQKKFGETPLQAIERFRAEMPALKNEPITYAGRLDPLATGFLLLLTGDDCKRKEEFLAFDKEYVVEVLFGIRTDSYDLLGIPEIASGGPGRTGKMCGPDLGGFDIQKYAGKFVQEYPPFSSKTVAGTPLHELYRSNELPDEMPTKQVEIFSIEKIAESAIAGEAVFERVRLVLETVKGDFRQKEIGESWSRLKKDTMGRTFPSISIKVKCSSGTYMRSLADRMGKDVGCGAVAYAIERTNLLH